MATTVEMKASPTPPTGSAPWYRDQQRRQRLLLAGGGGVLLAAAVVYFVAASGKRKEEFAARTLAQAQVATDAAQASSELQKVITTYKGTAAASEAVLALNQIRLHNNQAELAANNLKEYLAGNPDPRYAAPAAGLLGAALESAKRWGEAGDAYTKAAGMAQYDYLKAAHLISAGRAYRTGGLTDKAIQAYRTVLEKYGETPSAVEAQLRLAELTDGKQGELPAAPAGKKK